VLNSDADSYNSDNEGKYVENFTTLAKTVNKVLSESDPDTEPEGNTKNQDNIIGEDFHNLQEISTDKNLGISLEQFAPRTEMTKKKLEEIFKEEKNRRYKEILN